MFRNILLLLILGILCSPLAAQDAPPPCVDFIYLKDGSIYRGEIIDQIPGQHLILRTWNGRELNIHEMNIRRVVQRCEDDRRSSPRVYDFQENGWYHAMRKGFLVGQGYFGYPAIGVFLQYSTGYAWSRMRSLGIGIGAENMMVGEGAAGTYPLFVETRGYWKATRVSPYHAVGLGWGFAGRNASGRWGTIDDWKGGPMAKAELGLRLGNHFTIHTGVRLQKARRDWQSTWDDSFGRDRILFQRLELGLGLVF